jgi:hypothetical protein
MHAPLIRTIGALVIALALAAPAAAQIVINQSKAKAGLGGCDTPGFPVTLCKSGPYKLTGSLTPTAPNQTLIAVATNVVTIDLNSHYVGGNCSLGSTTGIGISTVGYRTQVTVLNGVVSCMGAAGIQLDGDNHRVERVTALYNGAQGIRVGWNGIVKDNNANHNGTQGIDSDFGVIIHGNTASNNGAIGIRTDSSSVTHNIVQENGIWGLWLGAGGYAFNVVRGNGSADIIGSGVSMGGNVCTAGPC